MEYTVDVIIQNKPAAKDPEGETILRELIHRHGFGMVESARVGKFIRLKISAESEKEAEQIAFRMCNELRIYNPVVHTCAIEVK